MPEIHAKRVEREMIDTWIEDDVIFEGDAKLDKNLNICGRFSGSIIAEGDVFVGKESTVVSNVTSRGSVYILGEVRGDIDAQERVELATDASLDGDVITGKMVIENGCYFNGSCKMRQN
ncbi:MAG: bactofilin family protein [Spirochaetia bacterium]